jgi:plasmid maintenance system antidote protein VapI
LAILGKGQDDLAKFCRVSPAQMSRILNYQRGCTEKMAHRIALFFAPFSVVIDTAKLLSETDSEDCS